MNAETFTNVQIKSMASIFNVHKMMKQKHSRYR